LIREDILHAFFPTYQPDMKLEALRDMKPLPVSYLLPGFEAFKTNHRRALLQINNQRHAAYGWQNKYQQFRRVFS